GGSHQYGNLAREQQPIRFQRLDRAWLLRRFRFRRRALGSLLFLASLGRLRLRSRLGLGRFVLLAFLVILSLGLAVVRPAVSVRLGPLERGPEKTRLGCQVTGDREMNGDRILEHARLVAELEDDDWAGRRVAGGQ